MVILLSSSFLSSCQKDNIGIYKQEAGVYFSGYDEIFSFLEYQDKVEQGYAEIKVPVLISGASLDSDRFFDVVIDNGNKNNTYEEGMLEIGRGIVKAGQYGGHLSVRINYSEKLNDSIYVAVVKIVATDDFPIVDLNGEPIRISFSNVLTMPGNWDRLESFFGPFSKSWYRFILGHLNCSSIPHKYNYGKDQPGITPEEAEKWPMNMHEVATLAAKVKLELENYNSIRPEDDHLIHEDGVRIGQKVVMP